MPRVGLKYIALLSLVFLAGCGGDVKDREGEALAALEYLGIAQPSQDKLNYDTLEITGSTVRISGIKTPRNYKVSQQVWAYPASIAVPQSPGQSR